MGHQMNQALGSGIWKVNPTAAGVLEKKETETLGDRRNFWFVLWDQLQEGLFLNRMKSHLG